MALLVSHRHNEKLITVINISLLTANTGDLLGAYDCVELYKYGSKN